MEKSFASSASARWTHRFEFEDESVDDDDGHGDDYQYSNFGEFEEFSQLGQLGRGSGGAFSSHRDDREVLVSLARMFDVDFTSLLWDCYGCVFRDFLVLALVEEIDY
jgi:hypothetical protein